jgi:hypothetical protein
MRIVEAPRTAPRVAWLAPSTSRISTARARIGNRPAVPSRHGGGHVLGGGVTQHLPAPWPPPVQTTLRGQLVDRRLSCPQCRKPGKFIDHDAKERAVYRCLSEDCQVVEYDREVVRLREGAVVTPPAHEHTPVRGEPRWWRPNAGVP